MTLWNQSRDRASAIPRRLDGLRSTDVYIQPGKGDIRRAVIKADLVGCMVDLPGQLFCNMQISVCLWFCEENNNLDSATGTRLFDGETQLSMVA